MWMAELRIPKKCYTQKWKENDRGRLRTRQIDHIRKGIEIKGEKWEEIQENRKWGNRNGWKFLC